MLPESLKTSLQEQLKRLKAIPDSIDYMGSLLELRMAIETAATHLKPGGILIVVGKTQEIFRDNNFAYTGEQESLHVTLLENNDINFALLSPAGYAER